MLGLNRSETSLSPYTEIPLVPTLHTQWLLTVSPRMNQILSSEENQVWLRLTPCRAQRVQILGHDHVLCFHPWTGLKILPQHPQPLWLLYVTWKFSNPAQHGQAVSWGAVLRGWTEVVEEEKSWAKIYWLDTKSEWIQGFQCGLLSTQPLFTLYRHDVKEATQVGLWCL